MNRTDSLTAALQEVIIDKIVPILSLRPNNWYLNRDKVAQVRLAWEKGIHQTLPLPLVTSIDGELSLIDGHSRVFVSFERGETFIKGIYKPISEIEGSTNLYTHIHRCGPAQGIRSIADLAERIISPEDHHMLWVGYCEKWLSQEEKHNESIS